MVSGWYVGRSRAGRRSARQVDPGRRDVGVDLGDGVDRGEDGQPDRGAAGGAQGVDRRRAGRPCRWSARPAAPAMPENATRPILVPSCWALMKSRAAFWAAVSRLGATSVEHIDAETSMASRIDAEFDGTGTDACGRAAPVASTTRPAANSQSGIRRRHSDRAGQRGPDQRDARHPHGRRAPAPPAHPPPEAEQQREGQQRDQGPRPGQRHQRIRPYQVIISSPPIVSSSTATPTASAGELDELRLGGDPQVERLVDVVERRRRRSARW